MMHLLVRCRRSELAAAVVLLVGGGRAWGSGDGQMGNWALDEFGGTTADRQLLYSGAPGVLMGTSPAGLLFIG